MKIDVTLKITPNMSRVAQDNEKRVLVGHLGTHFDVMNKEFPLEYTECPCVIFDVTNILDRDIEINDIDLDKVHKGMFVAFYSGFIEEVSYGTNDYFKTHPQLSNELIDALIIKGIYMIGVDFAGIRRGKEHPLKDLYCADNGVFVIENLCNLKSVLEYSDTCIMNTYPMNYANMSGLPCRVIAKI